MVQWYGVLMGFAFRKSFVIIICSCFHHHNIVCFRCMFVSFWMLRLFEERRRRRRHARSGPNVPSLGRSFADIGGDRWRMYIPREIEIHRVIIYVIIGYSSSIIDFRWARRRPLRDTFIEVYPTRGTSPIASDWVNLHWPSKNTRPCGYDKWLRRFQRCGSYDMYLTHGLKASKNIPFVSLSMQCCRIERKMDNQSETA